MRRVSTLRPTLALTALLTASSLLLAGCGGDDKADKESGEKTKGTGESQVLASTWPLTGLEAGPDESVEKDHPVLVVKVENTPEAAPQIGLGKADLVVEELVEGGITRFAAFYYSRLPENVGPVRSMRTSDIGIVKPVGGQLVTSGAAAPVIGRLRGAGVKFHEEGAPGFYRMSGRPAPHDLFVRLKELAKTTEGGDLPADYLPWGEAKDFPQGQPATSLSARFSYSSTTQWAFRNGKYEQTNTRAAAGDRFLADTVLVLRVRIGDAGYPGFNGALVPETIFSGKGQAMVFHGGRMVRGTWQKPKLDAPLKLKTKAGPLTIPAGKVFIELVPAQDGDVTFK